MKLQPIDSFESLNAEALQMISGGTALQESKKKDVTSETKDSASNDHFDYGTNP